MGLLSRNRAKKGDPAGFSSEDVVDLAVRLADLDERVKDLAARLDSTEQLLREMPNASDFQLIASDVARLESDLERIEQKHKEGMLVLYAQVYKELKAIRGDALVEMVETGSGDDENGERLEKELDRLSQLARNWRKMRTQPVVDEK